MNPFIYGGIIEEKALCNREKEYQDILNTIESGVNLFLYSERRQGKTSLIKKVISNLDRNKYQPIYVDLSGTDDIQEFISSYVKNITKDIKGGIDKIIEFSKSIFGRLRPKISFESDGLPTISIELSDASVIDDTLEDVLNSVVKLSKRHKKRVVVVFDEFQQVLEYPSDKIIRIMRAVIQNHINTPYIFLGSRKHLMQKLYDSPSKPFYKAGKHYPLMSISKSDWTPYIEERFRAGNRIISRENIDKILELTDCHPYHTQHLCHEIWEVSSNNKIINDDIIDKALETVLSRESGVYTTRWLSLTYNQKKVLKFLSKHIISDNPFSYDTLQEIGLKGTASLNRVYISLLEKDILDRSIEGKLYIQDRFFKIWIKRLS
ncbi:ATP-binding protein [Candidatus Margulisiibacteriota bacterium]